MRKAKIYKLTHSLGVLGSDLGCSLLSSDWKLITMETLNSIENGLQICHITNHSPKFTTRGVKRHANVRTVNITELCAYSIIINWIIQLLLTSNVISCLLYRMLFWAVVEIFATKFSQMLNKEIQNLTKTSDFKRLYTKSNKGAIRQGILAKMRA